MKLIDRIIRDRIAARRRRAIDIARAATIERNPALGQDLLASENSGDLQEGLSQRLGALLVRLSIAP